MESQLWFSKWYSNSLSRVHLSGAFCLCGWIFTTHVQCPFMRPLCFSLPHSPLCNEIVNELAQCYRPMSSFCLLGTLYLGLANLQNLAAGFGHVACMGHERCTQVLVGRLEGMRPLGRPSKRLEDNIKMALQEVGWLGIYWIDLS